MGAETAGVIGLDKSLAVKDGGSEEDEEAVERLAAEIGREEGFEPASLAERVAGAVGPYGLGTGLVHLVGLGLWGRYMQGQ